MSEKKIVELEEKIAFLQNMIDELNMVVFRQGEQIEKLNRLINEKLLDQSDKSSFENKSLNYRPPHY